MRRFLPALVALIAASLERLGSDSGPFSTLTGLISEPPHQQWGAPAPEGQGEDASVRPFPINISAAVLDDLRDRLVLETTDSRLHPPLEGIAFQYGFNSDYLKRLTRYWLEEYLDKWPAYQAWLNRYPHFKTRIQGLDIHFQHATATAAHARKYRTTRPLLILNGYPQSFVEFQRVLPLLTEPAEGDVNFDVVLPSPPGFAFSDKPQVSGLGLIEMAHMYATLMERLGYKQYYIHATNWGTTIANSMTVLYPDRVLGLHFTTCLTANALAGLRFGAAMLSPVPLYMSPEEATVFKGKSLLTTAKTYLREFAYYHLQTTKPDTLGASLSNSPSGLAAYILDKWAVFTNPDDALKKEDGGLGAVFQTDDLLATIMVHWVANSMTSTIRLYTEVTLHKALQTVAVEAVPIHAPAACLQPPYDSTFGMPRWALQARYKNLLKYQVLPRGGHFIALQEPELVGKDITSFLQSLEK